MMKPMSAPSLLSALKTVTNGMPKPAIERCVSNPRLPVKAPLFNEVREKLLSKYLSRTPSSVHAIELLKSKGAGIHNDHVALRSFNDGRGGSGLAFLEEYFLAFGYQAEQAIVIPGLPVNAKWYEPPELTDWPKIFISEMRANDLPSKLADVVSRNVRGYYQNDFVRKALDKADADALVTLLETPPWNITASEEEGLRNIGKDRPELASAVEYAVWTLTHAHRWNHMTILLNSCQLPGVSSLQDLNACLLKEGFVFNSAGGIDGFTQGSRAVRLEQSSTKADIVQHEFACGTVRDVPCSFLELIHRHDTFRGFLGQNAKGIFDSTSTSELANDNTVSVAVPLADRDSATAARA